jgi:uncharacterized protein (TIGR03067 family)
MRRYIVLALAVLLLIAADNPTKDETQEDANRLQGIWTVVSAEVDQQPDNAFTGKIMVVGSRFVILPKDLSLDEPEKLHYRLDATQNPKTIDFTINSQLYLLGIYELNGDTFRLCYSDIYNERPTEFTSKGQVLIQFRRAEQ